MSKALFAVLALSQQATAFRARRSNSNTWVSVVKGSRSVDPNLELHGRFRDLDLYKSRGAATPDDAAPLWVVEFQSPDDLDNVRARAEAEGLQILFEEQASLVIQGDVASLGYDDEWNATVVSVSDLEILPRAMPANDFSRYMDMATAKDVRNAAFQSQVSQSNLRDIIQKLQDYGTRNSYSGKQGLDPAADWAAAQLESYGFKVTRHLFQPGSGWFNPRITPQIIAEWAGSESPDRIFVVGAHLDSISDRGTSVGPGADDNGSGSATMLEVARIIAENGIKFKHTVRICLFTGEEQGLKGSRALAQKWRSEQLDIIGVLNADMTGYRAEGQPIQFALMDRSSDPGLVDIVLQNTDTYLGDQVQTARTQACCSDHQAFFESGFPATTVFESKKGGYPHYHKSTDLLQHLDMEQVELNAKAVASSTFLFAEFA